MKIYNGISELVGGTPLVRLSRIEKALGISGRLLAKLECMNPAGSAKDRVAKEIITDLENRGLLKKGSLIIEPTSGNTGVGIAAIAKERGYSAVIVMPSNMSKERQALIKAYGAELILTDASLGMAGAITEAKRLCEEAPGSVIAGQFTNPMNPEAHRKTTGPEIWEDTDGEVQIFVAGIGTGGTITGVGEYLKSKKSDVKIIGAEPLSSAVLSGGEAAPHAIQGIGAGFVPEILNREIIDEIVCVSDSEAVEYTRMIGRTEGIAVGISSGAALAAAVKTIKKEENQGKTVVVLFPDGGERYLSTSIFS